MKMDFQELKARQDDAYSYKQRWLALYIKAWYLVLPNRDANNILYDYRDDGKPTDLMIWDNTAQLAAKQRSNDLHSLMMPQGRRWAKPTLNPHVYPDDYIKSVQPQLDKVNETLFWYLDRSNLSRAVSSSLLDLNIGTAGIWVESINDAMPLSFTAIPGVCLFVEQTMDDIVYNAWYVTRLSGYKILSKFRDYKGPMLTQLKANPTEQYPVYYGQVKVSAHDEKDRFFIYAVLDGDPLNPLFCRYSDYQQLIIYRDQVRPGEADGRGIVLDMLETIDNLNQMMRDFRESTAYKANPMIFSDSNTYFNPGSLKKIAGSILRVAPGTMPMRAFEIPDSPQVWTEIQDLRQLVQKGFQVDPIGDLNTPVRTAEEISIREDRAQRTSQTDISRLQNELPNQIIKVSSIILRERGLLGGLYVKGNKKETLKLEEAMCFEYVSPIVDLQNQENLQNFQMYMQIMQQGMGEQALLSVVNPIKLSFQLQQWLNLPSDIFNDQALQLA